MTFEAIELNLLFVCVLGLGGSVLGLLGLLLGPKRGWTIAGLAFALLLFAGSATAVQEFPPLLSRGLVGLAVLSLLFSVSRCAWLCQAVGWLLRQAQRTRFQGLVLLVLSPALLIWWASQTEQQVPLLNENPPLPSLDIDPSKLEEVTAFHATTDRGRPVPLCTLPPSLVSAADLQRIEQSSVEQKKLAQKQIRTAAPENGYNCHGWVFAAGQFWVRGADVPRILEDNGYHAVRVPQPGDIIVYRDQDQAVTHTGLVRTVTEDGLVLVESKWGWLGRYVHRPEDQMYGDLWAYYHSDRNLHRLEGLGNATRASHLSP
jgi:hypothetical protein